MSVVFKQWMPYDKRENPGAFSTRSETHCNNVLIHVGLQHHWLQRQTTHWFGVRPKPRTQRCARLGQGRAQNPFSFSVSGCATIFRRDQVNPGSGHSEMLQSLALSESLSTISDSCNLNPLLFPNPCRPPGPQNTLLQAEFWHWKGRCSRDSLKSTRVFAIIIDFTWKAPRYYGDEW